MDGSRDVKFRLDETISRTMRSHDHIGHVVRRRQRGWRNKGNWSRSYSRPTAENQLYIGYRPTYCEQSLIRLRKVGSLDTISSVLRYVIVKRKVLGCYRLDETRDGFSRHIT